MTAWVDRSPLRGAYLNPALIAAIEAAAASEYGDSRGPMPWMLAFVVVPLVLHRPSREALPRDTRTHLSTWINRNPLLRSGFAARAQSLVPIVREGIRFGTRNEVLTFEKGGLVGAKLVDSHEEPVQSMLRASRLLGRWLAKTDQPSTVFALMGIQP